MMADYNWCLQSDNPEDIFGSIQKHPKREHFNNLTIKMYTMVKRQTNFSMKNTYYAIASSELLIMPDNCLLESNTCERN